MDKYCSSFFIKLFYCAAIIQHDLRKCFSVPIGLHCVEKNM